MLIRRADPALGIDNFHHEALSVHDQLRNDEDFYSEFEVIDDNVKDPMELPLKTRREPRSSLRYFFE